MKPLPTGYAAWRIPVGDETKPNLQLNWRVLVSCDVCYNPSAMGSKKTLGQARRRWEATVAPAERAILAVNGFLAGMEVFPSLQQSPAAQASQRAVIRWQKNHCTIYTVDPDLQREVVRSGLPSDEIPGDIFLRMPHVTPLFLIAEPIPVEDPDIGVTLFYNMFFANIAKDLVVNGRTGEFLPEPQLLLRFVWFGYSSENPDEFVFTTSSIHLTDTIDLHLSLENILERISPSAGKIAEISNRIRGENWEDLNRSLFPLATMLTLYVCSQEPDITPVTPPAILRQHKKNIAGGYQLHNLGVRVGSAIRQAKQVSPPSSNPPQGRTVLPHVRKAHWHRFWTGPRKGDPSQRKLVLRWIPPVAVNVDKGKIAPTVHPIRQPPQNK